MPDSAPGVVNYPGNRALTGADGSYIKRRGTQMAA